MRRWLKKVAGRLSAFVRRDRAEPTSSSSATTRGPLAAAVISSTTPQFVYTVTELKVPKSPTTPNAHFSIPSFSVHDSDKLVLPSKEIKDSFESTDALSRAPKSKALLVSVGLYMFGAIAHTTYVKIGIHYTKHVNPEWCKLITPGKDVKNIHAFLHNCERFES